MAERLFVLDTEMTQLADKIREKTNSTDSLSFPQGFINAIDNAAGGLNFEVVGGTTQPSNPKENTIWVNTSTAITGWELSSTQPTSPVADMVWISNNGTSLSPFNALKEDGSSKENKLMIYPTIAYQYIGSQWHVKPLQIYQNSIWNDLGQMFLYYNGNLCETVTGGWDGEAFVNSSGQIVFEESDYVEGFSTLSKIDKGNFTKLCVNIVSLNCTDVGDFNVVINTELESTSGDYVLADVVTTTVKVASISLSSITEDFYVYLYTYKTATAKVDAVWLE